jgi:CDP-diacylglycerol---glycerol-3-phosphate 3-phosphatidyltransferase
MFALLCPSDSRIISSEPRLLNLPNSITLSRIACIPVFVWVLSSSMVPPGTRELLAAAIFVLAAITDGLDGYLARKHGQISSVGMLLDPMADKLLVAAGLILLVKLTPNLMPPWIAVLVLGREFLITGLRSVAVREGFAIQARDVGKLKMVVQIVAVVSAVFAHGWYEWNWWGFIVGVEFTARLAIWFMVAVTIVSAVDYFLAFWHRVSRPAVPAKPIPAATTVATGRQQLL